MMVIIQLLRGDLLIKEDRNKILLDIVGDFCFVRVEDHIFDLFTVMVLELISEGTKKIIRKKG